MALHYVDDGFCMTFVEYVVVITHVFFGLFTIFSVLMWSFFVAHMALLDRLMVYLSKGAPYRSLNATVAQSKHCLF
jgi:hypothetical protein